MTPKSFREKKGWTLDEAARHLGLQGDHARRTYQRWETGECPPPLQVVAAVEKMSAGRVRASDWLQAQPDRAAS